MQKRENQPGISPAIPDRCRQTGSHVSHYRLRGIAGRRCHWSTEFNCFLSTHGDGLIPLSRFESAYILRFKGRRQQSEPLRDALGLKFECKLAVENGMLGRVLAHLVTA